MVLALLDDMQKCEPRADNFMEENFYKIDCVKCGTVSYHLTWSLFQIVIIMRGLPGSGKTHVAKLIRVCKQPLTV